MPNAEFCSELNRNISIVLDNALRTGNNLSPSNQFVAVKFAVAGQEHPIVVNDRCAPAARAYWSSYKGEITRRWRAIRLMSTIYGIYTEAAPDEVYALFTPNHLSNRNGYDPLGLRVWSENAVIRGDISDPSLPLILDASSDPYDNETTTEIVTVLQYPEANLVLGLLANAARTRVQQLQGNQY